MSVGRKQKSSSMLLTAALLLGTVSQALAEALDPGVIDPVGKLARISASVSKSSAELTNVSSALDKLNDELTRSEKDKTKVTKAQLDALQKRFKSTIDRSYVVEKDVKDSLARDQRDIENVRRVLKEIMAERQNKTVAKGARPARPVMTDAEIAECLKDLDDLSGTIKDLQKSLVDDGKSDKDEASPKKGLK